ncbi:MAG TPA: hypothetical protein VGG43_10830 [Acidimicrobiales bacterium]|jgi:hypothetical protein
MAVGIYIAEEGFTKEIYDSTLKEIAAAAPAPKGRSLHVALETDGMIQVFDIWDSLADFEAFGETLLPILAKAGLQLGQPMVANIHNTIKG